jgi:L-rhamnose mutarotase
MRVALHTRLKPGAEAAYEAAHREVPAELVGAIRRAGAREWTIWRSGLDLFHVLECDDYAHLLAELSELPVNIAWQARMAELLEAVHDYGPSGAHAGLPVVWELRSS